MANEITYSGSLSFHKGTERGTLSGSGHADMTGVHYVQAVQDIGTDEETVAKGDVATIGFVAFRNTDETNAVEFGPSAGVYAITLNAGEFAGPMRWAGANVLAKSLGASGTTVKVEYLIIEA